MKITPREIKLKNEMSCLLRNLTAEDAEAALTYLRTVSGETPFMLREPEEVTMTLEKEAAFLEGRRNSVDGLQIGAFLDGELVGSASVERAGNMSKVRHRGTFAIGLKEKIWGLGLGTQMSRLLISFAPQLGITQLELEVMEPNKRARALYEKLGFQICGTVPNASRLKSGDMMDEILMYLPL